MASKRGQRGAEAALPTKDDLEVAAHAGFTGEHDGAAALREGHLARHVGAIKKFEDLGLMTRRARERNDADAARDARPCADLYLSPADQAKALANTCRSFVDSAIARNQTERESADRDGRSVPDKIDPRVVTVKGAEVLVSDVNSYREDGSGNVMMDAIVAIPVTVGHLDPDVAQRVKQQSEAAGVPMSDKDRMWFPLTVTIKNPREQFQEPYYTSDGHQRADAVLAQAITEIPEAAAREFAGKPDPDFPSTGQPRLMDYKFLNDQLGEGATRKDRMEKAPTIHAVLSDSNRYSETDQGKAMRAAKGHVFARRSGIQRGAKMNFRCTSLEATLRRSVGEHTPAERIASAKGETVEPKAAMGAVSVKADGSLSTSRWAGSVGQVGMLSGGGITSVHRNRASTRIAIPDDVAATLRHTREVRERRSSSQSIAD